MLIAVEYEILRNVEANGTRKIPLLREPVRVATIMDEAAFLEKSELRHNETVFLEDKRSDWQWLDGAFYYYSRVVAIGDVVVVYELVERVNCSSCGVEHDKINRKRLCQSCSQ